MRTQKPTMSEYRQLEQLTPRGVIAHFANRAINETNQGIGSYAMQFAENYFRLVPEHQRRISVAHTGNIFCDAGAHEKLVSRWLTGSTHMPVEAMLPLIDALPEPFQYQCRVELTHQLGSMFVPIETANSTPTAEHFGDLIAAAGACISAGSRIFSDNKLDHLDSPFIPDFLQKINELQGLLTAVNTAALRCMSELESKKAEK